MEEIDLYTLILCTNSYPSEFFQNAVRFLFGWMFFWAHSHANRKIGALVFAVIFGNTWNVRNSTFGLTRCKGTERRIQGLCSDLLRPSSWHGLLGLKFAVVQNSAADPFEIYLLFKRKTQIIEWLCSLLNESCFVQATIILDDKIYIEAQAGNKKPL